MPNSEHRQSHPTPEEIAFATFEATQAQKEKVEWVLGLQKHYLDSLFKVRITKEITPKTANATALNMANINQPTVDYWIKHDPIFKGLVDYHAEKHSSSECLEELRNSRYSKILGRRSLTPYDGQRRTEEYYASLAQEASANSQVAVATEAVAAASTALLQEQVAATVKSDTAASPGPSNNQSAKIDYLIEKYTDLGHGARDITHRHALCLAINELTGDMKETCQLLKLAYPLDRHIFNVPPVMWEQIKDGTGLDQWRSLDVYRNSVDAINTWLSIGRFDPMPPVGKVQTKKLSPAVEPDPEAVGVEAGLKTEPLTAKVTSVALAPLTNTSTVEETADAKPFSKTKVLCEKYHSLKGRQDEKTRHLREAIYLELQFFDGNKRKNKQVETLLDISPATMWHNFNLTRAEQGEDFLDSDEKKLSWRELPVYKDAAAQMDIWLNEAHLETNPEKILVASAEKSAADISGGQTASQSPEDSSAVELLKEKYQSLTQKNIETTRLKQTIFWTVYESAGANNKARTCELLNIGYSTSYKMLRKNLPEDVSPEKIEDELIKWRQLDIYQAPLATINVWLNTPKQISDDVVSKIDEPVAAAAISPAPSTDVDPSAAITESDHSRVAELSRLYKYIKGKKPQDSYLRQAIFWTVYEAEGEQNISKTHKLMGLSPTVQWGSLQNLDEQYKEALKTGEGRQHWRELDIYKDAIAQIDAHLNAVSQEAPVAAVATILNTTDVHDSGSTDREAVAAPWSTSFVEPASAAPAAITVENESSKIAKLR